jgi:organic hydroperoxide reductase OsmC/OhrA
VNQPGGFGTKVTAFSDRVHIAGNRVASNLKLEGNMEAKYTYTVKAQFHQHDRSFVEAEHAAPRMVHFSAPPEFGGEPGTWTPEHFLVAAIASCFIATFQAVARASKLEFQGLEVSVEGVLEKDDHGFRFTKVALRPVLILCADVDRERALRLLEKSEKICLVTRSLSSEVRMEPKIFVEKPVAV